MNQRTYLGPAAGLPGGSASLVAAGLSRERLLVLVARVAVGAVGELALDVAVLGRPVAGHALGLQAQRPLAGDPARALAAAALLDRLGDGQAGVLAEGAVDRLRRVVHPHDAVGLPRLKEDPHDATARKHAEEALTR